MKKILVCALAALLAGCGSTPPTKIGADTYYSSKVNAAGMFGNVGAIAGDLMAEGGKHCAAMGREFELVTQNLTQPAPGQTPGNASITFRCVSQAGNPVMRRDQGVTTIERR